MTVRLYRATTLLQVHSIYIYITDKWFSSNFDSLEQLCEVGYDDSDKRATESNDVDWIANEEECQLLVVADVESFEDIPYKYPELFI